MNADGSALHESRTEAKLLHVLDDYLADRDTGRAGDPAALLAAHPGHRRRAAARAWR